MCLVFLGKALQVLESRGLDGCPWTVQASPAVGIPRKDLLTCLAAAEEGWIFVLKGRLGLALVALGISMHSEDMRSRWWTLWAKAWNEQ